MLEGHGDDDVANAYTARALRIRGSYGRRAGRGRVRGPLHEVRDGWAGAGLVRRSATGAAGTGTEAPAKVAVALRVCLNSLECYVYLYLAVRAHRGTERRSRRCPNLRGPTLT